MKIAGNMKSTHLSLADFFKDTRRLKRIGLVTILALYLTACHHIPTNVCDVLNSPRKYSERRTVVVKGMVEESTNLFFVKYYVIRDLNHDCRLTVITKRMLPVEGERVRVRGILDEAFKIGNERLLVLIEEEKQ